jgi:hypothetical protein
MTINRRHAIKQFLFVSAAVALIPSCVQPDNKQKASIILKKLSIDPEQEKLLAELSETIIPATDTPGAKDISAHLFVLKMMDDCASKEDQQKFMKGMEAFTTQFKTLSAGKSFIESTPEQRVAFVQQLQTATDKNTDLNNFYHTVKRLTIQAYTSSKFYLTKINVYKLIPGPYHGCVPVKASA